jgi:hypothetical protein
MHVRDMVPFPKMEIWSGTARVRKTRPQVTAALRTREVLVTSQGCHTCNWTTQHPEFKHPAVCILEVPLMNRKFFKVDQVNRSKHHPLLSEHSPLTPTNKHKHFGTKIYKIICRDQTLIRYDSLFFPWDGKEISYRNSRIILMKDILETIVQVCRLQQQSTKVGLPRYVTMTQPKCLMRTASGVKREVFSEVWRKYDVCVARWCVWDYHAKAQLHKFWS